MLFEAHPEIDIHEMSPLALAFAGDAVLELLVRQRLVETSRLQPGRLHSVATHYVSAHAQNQEHALIEPRKSRTSCAAAKMPAKPAWPSMPPRRNTAPPQALSTCWAGCT